MFRLFLLTSLIFFTTNSLALDLSDFKQKCESIGFKKGTEKFGECVLKLRDRVKNSHNQTIQKQQEALQLERQRQEIEYIKKQQALLKEREESAKTENLFKSLMMIGQGIDMYNGTGAFAPSNNNSPQGGLGLINSYQSGHNKICVYDTITGQETITLKNSVGICPLTP